MDILCGSGDILTTILGTLEVSLYPFTRYWENNLWKKTVPHCFKKVSAFVTKKPFGHKCKSFLFLCEGFWYGTFQLLKIFKTPRGFRRASLGSIKGRRGLKHQTPFYKGRNKIWKILVASIFDVYRLFFDRSGPWEAKKGGQKIFWSIL